MNKEESLKRVVELRQQQLDLYERILAELDNKNADVDALYREYDIEHGRISAEITVILNRIVREE